MQYACGKRTNAHTQHYTAPEHNHVTQKHSISYCFAGVRASHGSPTPSYKYNSILYFAALQVCAPVMASLQAGFGSLCVCWSLWRQQQQTLESLLMLTTTMRQQQTPSTAAGAAGCSCRGMLKAICTAAAAAKSLLLLGCERCS
jgi:hypothetical protein